MPHQNLLQKIKDNSITVSVVGLGYVGMPLLLTMGKKGISTIGYDVSIEKVSAFNHARPFLKDLDTKLLQSLLDQKKTFATKDITDLKKADIIVICVPTPLTQYQHPEMDYIHNALASIQKVLRKEQLIILESTTFPGTTTDIVIPTLEKTGLQSGSDFFVAYSPEREDPGNKKFKTASTPKIVGAEDAFSLELATSFYTQFIETIVPVSSSKVAESTKLMENIFRSVNIGLVNELKTVFSAMDIDIWEIIEAASTKPFGFMPFYPGPGIGGHCIPIDPLYLSWKSKEYNIETRFIRLANEINHSMPHYVVSGLSEALNDRFAKSIHGANILILGLAYKKNIDDARESPAEAIVTLLKKRKASISYHDPYISIESNPFYKDIASVDTLSPERIASFDACIILTDHDSIDWKMIVHSAKLVIDTRNATNQISYNHDHIIKL